MNGIRRGSDLVCVFAPIYRWFIYCAGRMDRVAVRVDQETILRIDGDALIGPPDAVVLTRPFQRRRWQHPSGRRWITYHEIRADSSDSI